MDWNLTSEILKKEFNGELIDVIKISNQNNKSIELILKKNENNELCIIGDNQYIDILTKLINKISPGMEFMLHFVLPMIRPLRIKIDADNLKVSEVSIGNKTISVSKLAKINNININNFSDLLNHNKNNEESSEEEDLSSDEEENNREESDESNKEESDESNKEESDESNEKMELNNINNLLGNMNLDSNLLGTMMGGLDTNNEKAVNPMNILGKMKDIWTNDFYDNADEQEDLDDFLVDDEEKEDKNNNTSTYSNIPKEDFVFEFCISNILDYEKQIDLINSNFKKEYFDLLIENLESNNDSTTFSQFNGITPEIIIDDNDDDESSKYIRLNFTNIPLKSINIKFDNTLQLKDILINITNFFYNK
jgi:hypothetical protein